MKEIEVRNEENFYFIEDSNFRARLTLINISPPPSPLSLRRTHLSGTSPSPFFKLKLHNREKYRNCNLLTEICVTVKHYNVLLARLNSLVMFV